MTNLEIMGKQSHTIIPHVQSLTLPSVKGTIQILPGHVEWIGILNPGTIQWEVDRQANQKVIQGGYAFIENQSWKIFLKGED